MSRHEDVKYLLKGRDNSYPCPHAAATSQQPFSIPQIYPSARKNRNNKIPLSVQLGNQEFHSFEFAS